MTMKLPFITIVSGLPRSTEYIFNIVEIKTTRQPTYVLADYDGDELKGTFHSQELQKVTKSDDAVYKIEKIIKKQKNKVLVK